MEVLDWAMLGSRILELTRHAVRVQREEEQGVERGPGVPFLRLVKTDDWEREGGQERETGTAA